MSRLLDSQLPYPQFNWYRARRDRFHAMGLNAKGRPYTGKRWTGLSVKELGTAEYARRYVKMKAFRHKWLKEQNANKL